MEVHSRAKRSLIIHVCVCVCLNRHVILCPSSIHHFFCQLNPRRNHSHARTLPHTHCRRGFRTTVTHQAKLDLDGFFNSSSQLTGSNSLASFLRFSIYLKRKTHPSQKKKSQKNNPHTHCPIQSEPSSRLCRLTTARISVSGLFVFGGDGVPTQGSVHTFLSSVSLKCLQCHVCDRWLLSDTIGMNISILLLTTTLTRAPLV